MSKLPLLGNHQRCWVRGRNAVTETLRAGRWRPHEVRVATSCDPALADAVRLAADAAGVPVREESAAALTKRCGGADHQGVAAKMPPFPHADAAQFFTEARFFAEAHRSTEENESAVVLLADGVQDPHNLGAMVRSAAEFGAAGVLLPTSNAVGVTAGVVHASAGAVNHVPVARTADPPGLLAGWKSRGVRVAAAVFDADAVFPWDADLSGPLVLAVGAESRGVSDGVKNLADVRVRIPSQDAVGSLNAAVAAGVLLYEWVRSGRLQPSPRERSERGGNAE